MEQSNSPTWSQLEMSAGKGARVPKLNQDIDIRRLPIGPEEAFILSRVDGLADENEIALGTGLPETRVHEVLHKLRTLGAIGFQGEARVPTPASGEQLALVRSSDAPTLRSPITARRAEPQESVRTSRKASLDDITRNALLERFHTQARQNHYQVLGVPRNATRQQIKAAYFDLIGRFHPDRYYGQDLGEDKVKLEQVFKRLTEAYDALTRSKERTAYDQTLPADEDAVLEPDVQASSTGDSTPARSFTSSDSGRAPDARKRALVRKLRASIPPVSASRPSTTLQAITAFRPSMARAAETIPAPRHSSAQAPSIRFLNAAEESLKEKNPVAAANSLRLALAANPEDAAIRQRLEQVQLQADAGRTEQLTAQAKAREDSGQYKDAAFLYGRAARGAGSSELFHRAAECALKAGENPRHAADFVKAGLELDPDDARLHLQLGRIYAEAGMVKSALSELEKAKRLSPDDVTIQSWIDRVKKGRL